MKTYKTWEVIKILTENPKLEFEIINSQPSKNKGKLFVSRTGYLRIVWDINSDLKGIDGNITLNDKWILIQQPTSFVKVLKSEKRVKVEHEIMLGLIPLEPRLKDYERFSMLMMFLSKHLASDKLKEVILNGKWYIEE